MSFAEVMEWASYREMRGTFNLGRRIEVGNGLVAFMVNRVNRGKAKLSDFTPHENHDSGGSITDVAKMLNAVPNLKAKRHDPNKPRKKRKS